MTDNNVRRVSYCEKLKPPGYWKEDPNGTHHLAPVDRYVCVDREKMLNFLKRIERRAHRLLELEITILAQDLIAEIEEVDDE